MSNPTNPSDAAVAALTPPWLQPATPFPPSIPRAVPWTASEERKLRKLREEVAALEARRVFARAQVEKVVGEAAAHLRAGTGTIGEWLIEHADEVRDALEPFDSGVRAAAS